MCIYTLFYILFHYGLSQDGEYSSLSYTLGLGCLNYHYNRQFKKKTFSLRKQYKIPTLTFTKFPYY